MPNDSSPFRRYCGPKPPLAELRACRHAGLLAREYGLTAEARAHLQAVICGADARPDDRVAQELAAAGLGNLDRPDLARLVAAICEANEAAIAVDEGWDIQPPKGGAA